MRLRLIVLVLFTVATPLQAVTYTFTRIADSSGPFQSFDSHPSINNSGLVAFTATLDAGVSGVYTGNGGPTVEMIGTGTTYAGFGPTTINNSGSVAFNANRLDGETAILVGSGTSASEIVDSTGDYKVLGGGFISDGGAVVFGGRFDSDNEAGVFNASGTVNTVASAASPNTLNLPHFASISSAGIIAFSAQLDDNSYAVFKFPTGVPALDTSGEYRDFPESVAINSSGSYALIALRDLGLTGGGAAIVKDGIKLTDTISGPFSTLLTGISMNASGTLAFRATRTGTTSSGIYTGTNPVNDKVIELGDPLDGSSVNSFGGGTAAPQAINDSGQIVFYVTLGDGRFGVYRADPVTGVDSCPADPTKTAPGQCGCGVPDTDTDGDSTADCNDGCPNDATKVAPGACGCGVTDTDTDGDGIADCVDNCPAVANADQADANGNSVGDLCEPAPAPATPGLPSDLGTPADCGAGSAGSCGAGVGGMLPFLIARQTLRRRRRNHKL
ncbi:MAG: thrombospondin type 3 repeat-containing protein [Planctomycetota bacterium]